VDYGISLPKITTVNNRMGQLFRLADIKTKCKNSMYEPGVGLDVLLEKMEEDQNQVQ